MFRFSLLLALAAVATALEFDCTSLVPLGRRVSDKQKDNPFIITIDTNKLYSAGDVVTVMVSSGRQTFNRFVIQARQPLADIALGEFELGGDDVVRRLARCENGGDTLTNRGHQSLQQVTAEWIVPSGLDNIQNIEFDIAVVSERKFWIFNSQMISLNAQKPASHHPTAEEERQHHKEHTPSDGEDKSPPPKQEDKGTGEDPNEPEKREQREREEAERRDHVNPLHDARTEQELALQQEERLRKEIEQEDQNSEGDWQKDEEEEKKQHDEEMHREEMEYEEQKAKEEKERMERIQFEIRDKEEHDRKKTKKVDMPTGGKVEGEIDLGDLVGRRLG